ncbi:hypothetical protein FD14_GL001383 [Secundilactobacillus similis DSM 23365 = JCM 2765]|uniref:Gram-positive cocci surface proteins LPxTG domain-containing protein n=1 Tax=Secundilactobacillus similis DSM 23365 = JCM 2765 TaxID=1423804 RepID=A0A0R2FDD9_9LACO|nr:hypothetical protein FD14_GL001383 [Secundilactobacillus similis DSM 23365 = JCM 2765]
MDADGGKLTVKTTDTDGNIKSTEVDVAGTPALTTDPAKNIDGTTTVTGTTKPGNTVVVTDEAGKEYPATVDDNGNYTVDVPVDADGGKLTVKTTDTDGNSKSTEVDVAGTPALTADPAKNIDGTTTVTGTTKPGNTVVVTDEAGKEYPATVDDNGNYTVDVPVDADGGKLTVKTTDTDGNSKSTEVDVAGTPALTTNPAKNIDGTTTVTGKTEPGNTVVVTDEAGKEYPATVDDNGNYTVDVPVDADGGKLTVKTTDTDGNSKSTEVDVAGTPALTTNPVTNDNGTATIGGTTTPGNTVVITDEAGKEYPATVDDNGNYTVDVPVDADGGKLTVKTTDTDGNSKSTEVDVAGTPTLTTDPAKNTDGTTTISGTTTPGNTVVVTDEAGNQYPATVDDNGNYTVDVPTGTDGGKLTITTTDKDGNSAATEVTVAGVPTITTSPAVNTNGATTISGTTTPGATVTVTDANGNVHTVVADDAGAFTLPNVVVSTDGGELTVAVTDAAGNHSEVKVTVPAAPALTLPDGTNYNGTATVTGTTTPGATVTITDGNGTSHTVTAGTDGKFTFTNLPVSMSASKLAVMVTDANGNTTQGTVAIPVATVPAAPDDATTDGDANATTGTTPNATTTDQANDTTVKSGKTTSATKSGQTVKTTGQGNDSEATLNNTVEADTVDSTSTGRSTGVTTKANATATATDELQSQSDANATTDADGQATLPQTSDDQTQTSGLIGLGLASLLAALGLAGKRRRKDEK